MLPVISSVPLNALLLSTLFDQRQKNGQLKKFFFSFWLINSFFQYKLPEKLHLLQLGQSEEILRDLASKLSTSY